MYEKASSLSAFISFQKLAIICHSESYLNYETSPSPNDNNLEIHCYNIIRKDRFLQKHTTF